MLITLNLSQKSALQLDLFLDSRFCLGHLKKMSLFTKLRLYFKDKFYTCPVNPLSLDVASNMLDFCMGLNVKI